MDGLMKRYLDRIASKPNVVVICSASGQASAGREALSIIEHYAITSSTVPSVGGYGACTQQLSVGVS